MSVSGKNWQESMKTTLHLMGLLLSIFIVITLFVGWVVAGGIVFWYRLVGLFIFAGFVLFTTTAFVGIISFQRLWYNKDMPKWLLEQSINFLHWIYPLLILTGRFLKKDKNDIRRVYTRINNLALLKRDRLFSPGEILILAPHCIQQSQCDIRITNDIFLCRECGCCNISDLIRIWRDYGVEIAVVTGGTLARKRIQEKKPALVIAIACERDLISGLFDVRKIPVYAVINDRPEGPCHNTRVDLQEVEQVLKRFIRGDNIDVSI